MKALADKHNYLYLVLLFALLCVLVLLPVSKGADSAEAFKSAEVKKVPDSRSLWHRLLTRDYHPVQYQSVNKVMKSTGEYQDKSFMFTKNVWNGSQMEEKNYSIDSKEEVYAPEVKQGVGYHYQKKLAGKPAKLTVLGETKFRARNDYKKTSYRGSKELHKEKWVDFDAFRWEYEGGTFDKEHEDATWYKFITNEQFQHVLESRKDKFRTWRNIMAYWIGFKFVLAESLLVLNGLATGHWNPFAAEAWRDVTLDGLAVEGVTGTSVALSAKIDAANLCGFKYWQRNICNSLKYYFELIPVDRGTGAVPRSTPPVALSAALKQSGEQFGFDPHKYAGTVKRQIGPGDPTNRSATTVGGLMPDTAYRVSARVYSSIKKDLMSYTITLENEIRTLPRWPVDVRAVATTSTTAIVTGASLTNESSPYTGAEAGRCFFTYRPITGHGNPSSGGGPSYGDNLMRRSSKKSEQPRSSGTSEEKYRDVDCPTKADEHPQLTLDDLQPNTDYAVTYHQAPKDDAWAGGEQTQVITTKRAPTFVSINVAVTDQAVAFSGVVDGDDVATKAWVEVGESADALYPVSGSELQAIGGGHLYTELTRPMAGQYFYRFVAQHVGSSRIEYGEVARFAVDDQLVELPASPVPPPSKCGGLVLAAFHVEAQCDGSGKSLRSIGSPDDHQDSTEEPSPAADLPGPVVANLSVKSTRLRVRNGKFKLRVKCESNRGQACDGRLQVSVNRRVLGFSRQRISLSAATSKTVTFKVQRNDLRALAKLAKGVKATIMFTGLSNTSMTTSKLPITH